MSLEFGSSEHSESVEQKKERLFSVFLWSLEQFQTVERLQEAAVTVTRRLADGSVETIPDLVVMEIDDDGPNLSGIDADGQPTNSATMLWTEILDVKRGR